jgi:hypothetical protein
MTDTGYALLVSVLLLAAVLWARAKQVERVTKEAVGNVGALDEATSSQ